MTSDKMLELSKEAGTPVKPDMDKMLQKVAQSAAFGVCAEA